MQNLMSNNYRSTQTRRVETVVKALDPDELSKAESALLLGAFLALALSMLSFTAL